MYARDSMSTKYISVIWGDRGYYFQARIQEYFRRGGGSNLQKEKKKTEQKHKRGEGGRFSIYSALIRSKSNLAMKQLSGQ